MRNTFKVLFYLKKVRAGGDGRCPIYSRLTVNAQRVEWTTHRWCTPEQWNKKSCRANGTSKEAKTINAWLEQWNARLYETQRELFAAGKEVTAARIRSLFNGQPEDDRPIQTILEVYQYHNDQFANLVGKDFASGTLKKYKTAFKSIQDFIKEKYKKSDLPITELNHQFITEYEYFLKTAKNIQHNSAMGMIKKLKKIVRECVANDWLVKDPFMSFKVKMRETHRPYLNGQELEELSKKKFSTGRLSLIKDLFVFGCYTGLAYIDLMNLKHLDLIIGIDREIWLNTARAKTGTPSRIPLLPQALEIVDRYRDDPRAVTVERVFPNISNQKINAYLKEIADCLGIQKELIFHCARHTFATTVTLTNGVPTETVSKMMGHRSLRTTQVYAKMLDNKVSDDMGALRRKLAV